MKRTIKFRAQSDNGDWCYSDDLASFFSGIEGGQLNSETLGQFTGLKDENGKEIYEGDIVILKDKHAPVVGRNKRVITMDTLLNWCSDVDSPFEHFLDYEIIGNIHDNPDLIKS